MSNDEECTLVRRGPAAAGPTLVSARRNAYVLPAPRPEPTSWNGISYDDMMRSLEDALPTDRRPTIVDPQSAPTRPVGFEPFSLTQRMPARPRAAALVVPTTPTTVAPVALPMRYVDLDGDVELDVDATAPRAIASAIASKTPSRKRTTRKGFFVGAALGMSIAVGSYAYVDPDARMSASVAASGARARVSSWVADARAQRSNDSPATAAAPPPVVAPVAPVAPVAAAAEHAQPAPVMTAAPAVPTMRAPTAPPVVRQAKAKRVESDEAKPAEVDAADPSSLLDRGLGN